MQTKIVKLDSVEPEMAEIKSAAAVIDAGGLVAFPTETVYGIVCRVKAGSLDKLNRLKGRSLDKFYTLHIGQRTDVEKYVPVIGMRAQKLVKNAWLGPLTIVFELEQMAMDRQRDMLDREVFEILYKDNSIGIRCPDNATASALLRLTHNPVVAPSANITGRSPAVDAQQVLDYFDGQIDLLLDAGPCKYGKSSTVAKMGKNGLEILRPGVYSQVELEEMSQVKFLFVCTGNTCRSPMAAGIFRKYIAEKLGCVVDRLETMGYKIYSAGTMGVVGLPASAESIAACAAKGIDISNHRSRALSKQLIDECDFIFVMGRIHRERVLAISPEAAKKCVLLAEDKDIPDPIGQSQEVYNDCAERIETAVKKRIGGFVI